MRLRLIIDIRIIWCALSHIELSVVIILMIFRTAIGQSRHFMFNRLFLPLILCKTSDLRSELHVMLMNLLHLLPISVLRNIRRSVFRLRRYTSIRNVRVSILILKDSFIFLLLQSLSRRKHAGPISRIPQFHMRVAQVLLLPMYLFEQLMSLNLRLLPELVEIFFVFLNLLIAQCLPEW